MNSDTKGGIRRDGYDGFVSNGHGGGLLWIGLLTLTLVAGCAEKLHKPTTAGNAGTSALVAYAVAGFTAGQYLKLPLCASPAVYPCKTKAVNDRLVAADLAAYTAAVAADHAGNPAEAQPAIDALSATNASPEVSTQVKLAGGGK